MVYNRNHVFMLTFVLALSCFTIGALTWADQSIEERVSNLETRVSVLEGTPLPAPTLTATPSATVMATYTPTVFVMPPTPSLETYENAGRVKPGAIFRPYFTLRVRAGPGTKYRIVSRVYKDDVIFLETGVVTAQDTGGYRWVELYGERDGDQWIATGRWAVDFGKMELFR